MDNTFWTALAASAAAAVVTTLGILTIRRFADWRQRHTAYFMCFAAGVLIYVGATHLLPRAEQEGRPFSLLALAGGVLVAVIIVVSKG